MLHFFDLQGIESGLKSDHQPLPRLGDVKKPKKKKVAYHSRNVWCKTLLDGSPMYVTDSGQ